MRGHCRADNAGFTALVTGFSIHLTNFTELFNVPNPSQKDLAGQREAAEELHTSSIEICLEAKHRLGKSTIPIDSTMRPLYLRCPAYTTVIQDCILLYGLHVFHHELFTNLSYIYILSKYLSSKHLANLLHDRAIHALSLLHLLAVLVHNTGRILGGANGVLPILLAHARVTLGHFSHLCARELRDIDLVGSDSALELLGVPGHVVRMVLRIVGWRGMMTDSSAWGETSPS